MLDAADDDVAARSATSVEVQAAILEAVGLDDQAVIVVHIGGVYGESKAARERLAWNIERLPPVAQRRLALENDDGRIGVKDVL